jgi:hypothetical protein
MDDGLAVLWLRWPVLPLPAGGPQDAAEVAEATTAPEASAPVLEAVAPQLACARCGAPLPASTGRGHPRTLCDDCRGQKRPRRKGQSGDVKPDARPLKIPDYDSPEVRQALEPPPLPWQTR